MAGQAQAANAAAKKGVQPAFAMHSLWRMALWGTTAATALLVAILATRSDAGSQRFATAGARQFDAEAAARQLAQAVRGLNEDRDRLTARVAALEHGLDDITALSRAGAKRPHLRRSNGLIRRPTRKPPTPQQQMPLEQMRPRRVRRE